MSLHCMIRVLQAPRRFWPGPSFHTILTALVIFSASCQPSNPPPMSPNFPIQKSEEEWLQKLGVERYRIVRQKGTEYPGTGEYDAHFDTGIYACAGCGTPLFSSARKFDAHCGWPSFDQEVGDGNVVEQVDLAHGMIRTEILCSQCGGHLGHVFDDGPTETGRRYCVNSLSLSFTPAPDSTSTDSSQH